MRAVNKVHFGGEMGGGGGGGGWAEGLLLFMCKLNICMFSFFFFRPMTMTCRQTDRMTDKECP